MSTPQLAAIECERRRGCTFAENFVSASRVALNDGAPSGSPTISHGLVVDGSQYVTFDAVSSGLPATAVVRFSAAGVSAGVLFGNANLISGSPVDGFCIWVDADGIKAAYSDGVSIETALAIDLDYADGETHTATYVFSASVHTLYVDDASTTAATTTAGPIGAASALIAGGDGTDNFVGTIYSARLFDAALTAIEHGLYADDKLETFIADAMAAYGCDSFGDDTVGDRIWDNLDSNLDLVKGDGVTAGAYPTFVEHDTHKTQYYTFDGIDDYVSNWPTMPSTYTVSAVLSDEYPDGEPYISQVNDATLKNLLTVSGAFAGNLHNLMIFEGELSPLQLYQLETVQMSRTWRLRYADAFLHRLIRGGECVLAVRLTDPEYMLTDLSAYDQTLTAGGVLTLAGGADFGADGYINVSDDASIRLAEATVFVVGSLPTTGTNVLTDKTADLACEYDAAASEWSVQGVAVTPTRAQLRTAALTFVSGAAWDLYTDGRYDASSSSTVSAPGTDTGDLTIGSASGINPWGATVEFIAVFNRRLTPVEIRVLHYVYGSDTGYPANVPVIYDVDGDDIVDDAQADVVIDCLRAGAVAGTLYLTDNPVLSLATTAVEQSVNSWSDTEIQYDVDVGDL